MGVAVSSSHVVSAASSSSLSAPAPAWLPSHGRQFFMNFSSVSPSHGAQSFRNRLLQRGSSRGHKPCQQTCSGVGSSLHGSAGPGRSLLQRGAPHSLLRAFTCSGVGSSLGCAWRSAPLWASMCCRGTACLTRVCSAGCRGICAGAWSTSCPPFSLTLMSAGLFLSHILTPLSCCTLLLCRFFPLKYVLAQPWAVVDPSWG